MDLRKGFVDEVKNIIEDSRVKAIRSVDHVRVKMYWELGRKIVEEEQQGKDRAEYGKFLIKNLSESLTAEYGSGFSKRRLHLYCQFYKTYPIVPAVRAQLGWSHFKILLSIENQHKRDFYQEECIKNTWSYRQLERQVNAGLYERLLISNDAESVLSVARSERQPIDAKEIIKDPMVLELGNGFAFMSRQKRIHLDGDDFFIDLVLYNRLLQCFVIIEIKTSKITHQDIGQLQMYVNYHDRFEKKEYENPTIGILLCADKNDAVVKITLPENNQTIVASKYQLYLPSEEQLLEVVKSEVRLEI
jgi:predicted nuclease of restriction endonuclease-like (RecB) superfamily